MRISQETEEIETLLPHLNTGINQSIFLTNSLIVQNTSWNNVYH